ncbi:hypothetical protein FIBSPDRAFT_880162 [Athelia psychrophila]|uniref:Uncharacterized protein n=1 Tax=Athelia psychrophila TaxID=1759441 RepID=A0A167T6W0_9AGAM|nr:hypothetical protein FIBSPDRAFT_880162 [Fibularhizoctonia sp. CBS 109695]
MLGNDGPDGRPSGRIAPYQLSITPEPTIEDVIRFPYHDLAQIWVICPHDHQCLVSAYKGPES